MKVDREAWPFLVRLGLWGLPNRSAAWVCFWLSAALAVACVAYGFHNPLFFVGGLLVIAAAWYYVSIRWVDKHSHWD